ncbi:hypothetical protein [Xanthobacter versatilis]|uniref:hypothetical protein n=1 Tax=Xanthobacter autotrophicus (strain ATCC BAA-1158 / Py2) TaxID=78245 RepID=UPI003727B10C
MHEQTVNASELAALLGLSQRRVFDLARDGVIPKAGRRFPMPAAVRAYCEHVRMAAAGRGGDADTLSEKRREAKERADKLALANAKARGDLVSKEEVATTWVSLLVDVRAALLAVSTRVPELPKAMARRVDEEIRAALIRLADG